MSAGTRLTDLPIFRQVMDDTSLSERDLQVWRAVSRLLDVVAMRELKLAVLELETRPPGRRRGLSRSTLSVSLGRLCTLGYLVRQRAGEHEAWQYRIPLSRAAAAGPIDELPSPTPPRRAGRRGRSGMVSRGL